MKWRKAKEEQKRGQKKKGQFILTKQKQISKQNQSPRKRQESSKANRVLGVSWIENQKAAESVGKISTFSNQ